MEEVDSIIFHFFNQLNISVDESAKSLSDLSVETIVEAASTCVFTINPSLKVPRKLPPGISHRIEVAAQVAAACKDLGYKNDVGYQTFLYYNECELRQVFMFLIEQLPNEGKQMSTTSSTASTKSLLLQTIGNKIAQELYSIWIPPKCNKTAQVIGDFVTPESRTNHVPKVTLSEEELVQKLLKFSASKPMAAFEETASTEQDLIIELENKPIINESLKELKEMAIILQQRLDTLESEKNIMEVEYSKAHKSCERVEAELKNVQNILHSIGISEDAQNAGDNLLEKVQKNINKLHRKSEDLTSQNLSLKADIDKLKTNGYINDSERTRCKNILSSLKENAKAMKLEFDNKEELKKKFKSIYDKLRGGNKRSIYTKRILEIISNVDKQNMEIKKILDDTRQLQKEINTLEGQLDRCFSIADETLFRDAKKDDQAKKAYKLLALLHSECNTIVSLVNDTGTLARDIVDLEENIKTETAKKTEDTLRKIQLDLTRIQEET